MQKIRALLCVMLLAFCVSSVSAHAGQEIRFSWWGGSERHEATLAAIRLFEERNPGVTVKAEYMGWDGYLERLTMQLGSMSEPDLMQIDWAWLAMFSKDGNGFFDLNTGPDAQTLKDEFEQHWRDSGSVLGKLNALPVTFTAIVFLYRRDMWEKVGIPYPETWDDLLAAGKTFKEKLGPEYYPLDNFVDEIIYITHAYILQKTGKQYLNPDKPEVALTKDELMEWLGFYRKLIDNGVLMDPQQRASIGGRYSDEFVQFIDGRWAGSSTWDGSLVNRLSTVNPSDYDIGPFPTLRDAKSSGRVGRPGMLFAVSKNSKNINIASRLATFLLSDPDSVKLLKSTRGPLLTKTGYKTLIDENLIAPINQVAIAQINATQCYTPNPYFEHARTLNLLREVFEGVGYGTVSIEDGATRLLEEGNQIVTRLAR